MTQTSPVFRKAFNLMLANPTSRGLGLALALSLAGCAAAPAPESAVATATSAPPPAMSYAAAEPAPAPALPPAVGQVDQPVRLNPDHPEQYVVQRGDTLWDIAGRFLRDPWFWPEIWYVNPQVENPHLIYPGDILSLVYVDGRPRIVLQRGRTERLSPRVRVEELDQAIPTVSSEAIRGFLSRAEVLEKNEIRRLPYIVRLRDQRLIAGAGQDVYTRGTEGGIGSVYNVVHVGDPLVDPDDGEVVGYEGLLVGSGRIRRTGDPATLYLTSTNREALEGDRLIADEVDLPLTFFPRAPEQPIEGRIISVTDGVTRIGAYQVVVINRGARHGVEPGHVLQVYQTGEVIRDRVGGAGIGEGSWVDRASQSLFGGEKVRLPDEPAGTMMIFKTFDRISYGLVVTAQSEMRVLDTVRNPAPGAI